MSSAVPDSLPWTPFPGSWILGLLSPAVFKAPSKLLSFVLPLDYFWLIKSGIWTIPQDTCPGVKVTEFPHEPPKDEFCTEPLPQPDAQPQSCSLARDSNRRAKALEAELTWIHHTAGDRDSIRSWGRVHPSQLDKCKPSMVAGSTWETLGASLITSFFHQNQTLEMNGIKWMERQKLLAEKEKSIKRT